MIKKTISSYHITFCSVYREIERVDNDMDRKIKELNQLKIDLGKTFSFKFKQSTQIQPAYEQSHKFLRQD